MTGKRRKQKLGRIPASKRSTQGHVLTYSRLKRKKSLSALYHHQRGGGDLNFCVRGTPARSEICGKVSSSFALIWLPLLQPSKKPLQISPNGSLDPQKGPSVDWRSIENGSTQTQLWVLLPRLTYWSWATNLGRWHEGAAQKDQCYACLSDQVKLCV